jgi:hypothetical protein
VLCIGTVPFERDGSQGKACGGVFDTVEALDPGHVGSREAELGRENAVDRVLVARIAELGEVEIEGVISVLLRGRVLLARPELAEGPGARAAIVGDGDRTADGEVGADSVSGFRTLSCASSRPRKRAPTTRTSPTPTARPRAVSAVRPGRRRSSAARYRM